MNRAKLISIQPWFIYVVLILITGLGAVLRFYKLGEWSFWIDEIFTINRASIHYKDFATTIQTISRSVWIPISVILTSASINLFGVGEWSARLVSAIIGTLTVPILYFPVKKYFGKGAGLIAALLLAVSPWHITWSQNARFYALLFPLYLLSLFSLHAGLEKDRARYLFLFLGLFFFALSERLTAIFLAPAIAVYLILLIILPFEKPPGLRWRNIMILLIPVIGEGVIEAISFITWGESRFFADFDWFFLYRIETPLRMFSYISFDIGIPILVLGIFGAVYLWSQKNRLGLLIFLGGLTPFVLVIALNPFMYTEDRYVFPALSCWIMLAAVAIKTLYEHINQSGRILALGVLCLLIAHAGGDNLFYFYANNGNRLDWKGAFTLAQERSEEGDIFVTWWTEFGPFYLPNQEVVPWSTITSDMVLESNQRYWFILDQDTIWANQKMRHWVFENAELIDILYLRTPDEVSLKIFFYDATRRSQSDTSFK